MTKKHNFAVADASFVIGLGNKYDAHHDACRAVHRQQTMIYMPQTTLAEVSYMLNREIGNRAFAQFMRLLPNMKYEIIPLASRDIDRAVEIIEKYADSRVDFVDASVAAVAERLEVIQILTLDKRDFSIIRPKHVDYFELLP